MKTKAVIGVFVQLLSRAGCGLERTIQSPCNLQCELKALIAGSMQKEPPFRDGRRDCAAVEWIVERRDHVIIADSEAEALSPRTQ